MKRTILLFAAILLLGISSLPAQTTTFQPEWAFGVNASGTLSSMRFTGGKSITQTMLFQAPGAGLTVRYLSEKNFGVQAELNYTQRGWSETLSANDTVAYKHGLSYVELPLMTHIYFDMGKRARVVFNLGPQLGYFLSEDIDVKEYHPTQPDAELHEYYRMKVQHKFDYGIAGGGGVEVRSGIGSFILEGRYYFGLSDIFNNSKADLFGSSGNQVISVRFTYLYRF